MEEKQLNPSESLAIIDSMINTAKNKLADDGFLFIFWGWLVFSAALIHYITIAANIPYGYWVWVIGMPFGGIISLIYGYRQKKTSRVRTYVDSYLGYCWSAFIIAMFITLSVMPLYGVKITYFFLIQLYGVATFVTGGLLNFRPLMIGGISAFACAVCSIFLGPEEQLLCIAAAILLSYIIPGHLLRAKFKSQDNV